MKKDCKNLVKFAMRLLFCTFLDYYVLKVDSNYIDIKKHVSNKNK